MTVRIASEPVTHAVAVLAAPMSDAAGPADVAALRRRGDLPLRVVIDLAAWHNQPAAAMLALADALRSYWAELEAAGGQLVLVAEANSRLATFLVGLPVVATVEEAVATLAHEERRRETERRQRERVTSRRLAVPDEAAKASRAEEKEQASAPPAAAAAAAAADAPSRPPQAGGPARSARGGGARSWSRSRAAKQGAAKRRVAAAEELAAAEVVAAETLAAAAPAPATTTATASLQRLTTVRYFQQMNPLRNFPLLVLFTEQVVERLAMARVEQAEGAGIEVTRDRPIVSVVPRFPGCLVIPDRLDIDVTPGSVEAQFFVTPFAPGDVRHARVEVWHEGRCLDVIETPCVVRTQFWARAMAVGGVLNPVLFGMLDGLGVSAQGNLSSSALLVQAAAWFGNSYFALGLACAAAFGAAGYAFYRYNRPRAADPVARFLQWQPAQAGGAGAGADADAASSLVSSG